MEKLAFPKEIMIEVTNYCNQKCFFCANSVSDRKKGYIKPELAKRLISEAYLLGCRKISFHGMGEPFLCKELSEYVGGAKEIGYEYIYLTSNGTLATADIVEPVLDAGLDSLKFSIHAATSETFKKITNNDSFEKVYENVKHISDYIKKKNLKCKTIAYFALSKMNESEAEQFRVMMEPYFSEVWVMPIHNASGVKPENEKYAVQGNKVISTESLPCFELYNRIIINWEGKAIGCCTDWTGDLVYGDIKENTLEEVWNNERMQELRKRHQSEETLPAICKSCMGL